MICYAFAVPHEAEDLIGRLKDADTFRVGITQCTVGKLKDRTILVAVIGMGMTQAAFGTDVVFQHFRLKAFILGGYGGALVPSLKKGAVILSDNFTSEAVLPFVRLLSGFDFAKICSTEEVVATAARKAEFAAALDAQVVDMETASVADVVNARGLPFIVVRGISDTADEDLPLGALEAGFDANQLRTTPGKLVGYLLRHPGEIGPFKRFVQDLPRVRKNMTDFLIQLTDELPKSW